MKDMVFMFMQINQDMKDTGKMMQDMDKEKKYGQMNQLFMMDIL